jgi:hypothetical protein
MEPWIVYTVTPVGRAGWHTMQVFLAGGVSVCLVYLFFYCWLSAHDSFLGWRKARRRLSFIPQMQAAQRSLAERDARASERARIKAESDARWVKLSREVAERSAQNRREAEASRAAVERCALGVIPPRQDDVPVSSPTERTNTGSKPSIDADALAKSVAEVRGDVHDSWLLRGGAK